MRHVSGTHGVALDWLYTLIPNIHSQTFWPKVISHVTNGTIFLHLFNIRHFSSTCCAKNSSLIRCLKTMAKRMQEQERENRIVAKSKPTTVNLSSRVLTSSASAKSPIASQSKGILTATRKPESRTRRNSESDAASSFSSPTERCILWRVNGHSHGETCRYKRSFRIWNCEWRRCDRETGCL